jgi:hypothetical protein
MVRNDAPVARSRAQKVGHCTGGDHATVLALSYLIRLWNIADSRSISSSVLGRDQSLCTAGANALK